MMPFNQPEDVSGATTLVRIDGAAHLGNGVGRVDGKVHMVPLTAVGDLVRVRVTADHRTWAEAEIVEIVEPGPGRTAPACPVYGRCGGCHLQHLDDDARAKWKRSVFHDVMTRIGKFSMPEVEYVPSGLLNWRCRVSMHADGLARDAGFFARASHKIVPPGRCPIAMDAVAGLLEPVRKAVRGAMGRGNAEVELVCGADGRCVAVINQEHGDPAKLHGAVAAVAGVNGTVSRGGAPRWTVTGDTTILWPTAGLPGCLEHIEVDPRGFTQAHMAMNPMLVEAVIGRAGDKVDGLKVLELYAGAGNITLPLALRGADIFATDINAQAVEAGVASCRKRGLKVAHAAGRTVDVLAGLPRGFTAPDVVIADPPRTGMGRDAEAIAALNAQRVVISSCEPSALARDIAAFFAAGYLIDRALVVDMFPSTYHMEAVISLTFQR